MPHRIIIGAVVCFDTERLRESEIANWTTAFVEKSLGVGGSTNDTAINVLVEDQDENPPMPLQIQIPGKATYVDTTAIALQRAVAHLEANPAQSTDMPQMQVLLSIGGKNFCRSGLVFHAFRLPLDDRKPVIDVFDVVTNFHEWETGWMDTNVPGRYFRENL